jgi:UMF1 family MFS transporter
MATIAEGGWQYAAVLFVVANIAIASSLVFYDSLLPHIAGASEIDRVSTAAYAVGFMGGGILLALNLAWILTPATFGLASPLAAIKLSFVSVAVWWLVFSLPVLRRVPEPPAALESDETGHENAVVVAFQRVWETFHELRQFRQAFLMLVAFLLYSDGIQTIIRMAAVYGQEIGIDRNSQIAAFVMVQFVGVPFSFLFGALADRIGAKAGIFIALVIYTGISVLGYFMTTTWHFFVLAFLVAIVQGGSQALSRSVFARMIPRHKSSEFFGFFSVFEKFAGIFGPALFAVSVSAFGSSRLAVLSACETAVGDHGDGREIAGLAYQLEVRGAASVMASLWSVDDASTSRMMVRLYGDLGRKDTTRAEALRQAQLALLADPDTAHPYYWAPFVLIGDWR